MQFVPLFLIREDCAHAVRITPCALPRSEVSSPSGDSLLSELFSDPGPPGGNVGQIAVTRIVMILAFYDLGRR